MKHFLRYGLLFFVIAFPAIAHAQVSVPMKGWTIQECVRYATEHNIQINTLRLNEQTAEQYLSAAKGAKIPNLIASVSNTFDNANNNVNGTGNLTNQLTSIGNYSLNSSIVLWNDNSVNNTILQRNLLTKSAVLSVVEAQNNIILSITQAYLDILLAKENEKYVTDLVNTTGASVKLGEMLYSAGSIAKKDLLQLQAQWASNKYFLVQTQNTIRQNILNLKQLLQLSSGIAFDVVTPAETDVKVALPSLAEVQQTAEANFPEIQISKLGIDIASTNVVLAKSGFKPVLKANCALGSGYSDVITNAVANSANPKTGYFTQTGNNFYQNLGLTLSVPIFSNRINKTNLAKANIAYKQANLNLQNSQLVLSQSVEQAYLNALNAQQSYDAANQQLLAGSESYRIANEQLKLGAINTYDLLVQQNQYIQAVQAFTQAKYSAVLQQKIYEFYLGNPVTL